MKRKILTLLIVMTIISGVLPVGAFAAETEYPWIWYDYSEASGDPTSSNCTYSLTDSDGAGTEKGALKVVVNSLNGTPVYSGLSFEVGKKYRFSAWIKIDDIDLNIADPTFSFILFTKQAASSENSYNIIEAPISNFKQGEWVYAEKEWTCTGISDLNKELDMTANSSLQLRFGSKNNNWANVNNGASYSYLLDDLRIEPVYDEAESNIEPSDSLRNADFEEGFCEPFWTVESTADITEIGGANSTAKAILISGGSYGIKQKTTVEENTIYKIGFWAKAGSESAESTNVSVNVDFSELDGMSASDKIVLPQDSIDKRSTSFTLNDEWQHYECSFVNKAISGYSGMPYLYFTQSCGNLDIAIDEITIEKSNELVCDGNFNAVDSFWTKTDVNVETYSDDAPANYTGNVIKIEETSNSGTIKQTVPLKKDKTYKIGFWAKGISWNGTDETLKTVVTFARTGVAAADTVTDDNKKLTKEWQYFEYEYTPTLDGMPDVGLKFGGGRKKAKYLLAGFTITEKTDGQASTPSSFTGLDYLIANGKMIEGEKITVSGKYVGDGAPQYLVRTFVSENAKGYVLTGYKYVSGSFDVSADVEEKTVGRSFKFEAIPTETGGKMKSVVTTAAKPLFKIDTKCVSGFESETLSFTVDVENNKQDSKILVMLAQYDKDMEMLWLEELYKPVAKYGTLKGQSISCAKKSDAVLAKLMVWEGESSVNNSSVSYASHIIKKQ